MVLDATTSRRVTLLRSMPLFSELNESQLATMVNELHLREYKKNDLIFHQGDESRAVYVVLRGKVRIFKISPAGNETTIAIFSTHDVIGELAAIDNKPRSATAKAVTDVSLLAMSQQRFLHYLQTAPGLAYGLSKMLAAKLRWTAAYAESIAQFDAAGRLLHILLLNNERYGQAIEPGKRYVVDLGLTQSDLASMVGARREWVNRILNDWRRRGLLEFDRGVITILDLPRVVNERDSRIEANLSRVEW